MKITSILSGTLVASVLFASSAAMAAPDRHAQPNVNIPKLEMRIDAGVKSGQLTQGEERQLRGELRSLAFAVKAAMNDHKVTKRERANLEGKEAALGKHISKLATNKVFIKKHDDRRAPPPPMKPGSDNKKPIDQHNGHQQSDNGHQVFNQHNQR